MVVDQKWFEYMIGVLQGDGTMRYNSYKGTKHPSGISIAVGKGDAAYAHVLRQIIQKMNENLKPKIRCEKVLRVSFYKSDLAREFAKYKSEGTWSIPQLKYPEYYLAGLWDTDGYVGKSRRNRLYLSVKRSGNLQIVKGLLEKIGFERVKIVEKEYTNELGTFECESISFASKKDTEKFAKCIPLQHPRKIAEISAKMAQFATVSPRRGHKEMLGTIVAFLRTHPRSNSSKIACHLGKYRPSDITKELLRYSELNLLKRELDATGRRYLYSMP